ncbi:MAG TPA: dethiobiotin synthase, partial [Gammaproteobacteria bacterium]
MSSARGLFVTGTDTGVGKTLVAAALRLRLRAAGLRVAGYKPVAAGCDAGAGGLRNSDAELLRASATERWPYAAVNPYALAPPIAPHLAAAEAGVTLDLERLVAGYATLAEASDAVVVEGAGGWLVPLDDRLTLADLAARLGLDVVLVVGVRLGCLNHALLTAASVAAHGLRLAGWVANVIDPEVERLDGQLETLRRRLAAPCLGCIPRLPSAE